MKDIMTEYEQSTGEQPEIKRVSLWNVASIHGMDLESNSEWKGTE